VNSALDFVVIGAQKGGTTTLFEHLRAHPALCLPADKEAPFFNRPELYARGVDTLFSTYFPQPLPEGRLLGTVTPQYMCIGGCASRLADAFPRCRLVAVLRDPVDRAFSHYRMAVRRDQERRSFDDAVADMLAGPAALAGARASTKLGETYVAWSEYGRVLGDYLERFDRDRLLITFTSDLEQDPAGVLRSIYDFLEVPVVLPDAERLGARHHVGGSQRRFPNVQRRLRRSPLGWVWRRVPQRTRSRVFMRFDHWNVRTEPVDGANRGEQGAPGAGRSAATEARLRSHFATDEAALAARTGLVLPWSGG
jgi:Sulfotransferase domain